ncbi:DUF4082 domain-containing protein [Arthrobacter wenxiniae]|uniref:DUF4082 domain-containing protein n=1 Tax=Arthrobacter wenxiniae TaxID=2713570 RepID=A0A7Y7IF77_9MICC|nr:DUF4082 domain-containing protein [Arthrobacter wenxiniae]NVM94382.1 DUF4082 domain-containing protein [Arthrobacter wenxiniae]
MVTATLVLGTVGSAAAADPCGVGSNPISCENSKPGTDPSIWDISGAGDTDIQGFSTDISVNVGQTIGFKIKTTAAAYTIDIYRTGYYQGLGARKIASVTPSATLPQSQPQCLTDATTQLYDCGTWALSASWAVPTTAVSGVYIALLTRPDNGDKSQITFIVRNDASHSNVVFQTSDPTWQAYNTYGGADFYQGAAIGRAFKISYNRPVVTRGDNDGRDFYFANEYPMVRFLEQNGYDVSYIAGVDSDRHGSLLKNHNVFLSVGHDEYWSAAQRANITAAGNAGVNLQFLSGNDDYWHTRYEASTTDNTSYRTITSYKETWSNAKIDPSAEWTGTWRDPRFASQANGAGLPENALSGTIYMSNYTDLPVTVSAAEGKTRLWRNTGLSTLAPGTTQALAPHTIGYESNEDLDNGFRPAGLIRLSTTVGPTDQYLQDFGNVVLPGTTTHNITLYKNAGGALIFSAGSVQWTWGLDQTHDGNGAPADPRMRQAEVNLLADMGAQPVTLDPALARATASTDTTPPVVTVSTPSSGATIANGAKVTVTGTASDVGGVVAGVEVSTDAGASWHPAKGTSSWTYSYIQHGVGAMAVLARGIDDSANYPSTPTSVPVQVAGPYSVLGDEVPANVDSGDGSATVLGLRFTPNQSGYVSGVRFYKSAANTGVHTGTVWDSSGKQLATVTFSNESASGWQSAKFISPVKVTAGQTYVVSYTAPNGHYSYASYYWAYAGTTAAPMSIAGGFGAAPAGVYNTNGSFPTDSYQGSNYYVDAIFETTDTSPLSATGQVPAGGASSVAVGTPVSAVLSKDVVSTSVNISLKTAAGAAVSGTQAYDPTTRTATFTPSAALDTGTNYTATIAATDANGISLSQGGTWSFKTVLPDTATGDCPCSLYQDSSVPTVLSIADGKSVSLGVKFNPTSNGTITGIKFYKGPGNIGPHAGTLYKSDGTQLATVTFSNETTSGWQSAAFSTPVAVTAGTEYVAGYTNPTGTYPATPGAYSNDVTTGPLHVPANGAMYSYTANFPNNPSSSSYLVDVIFQPAPTPLTASSQQPPDGATSVALNAPIKAVLSKNVNASSVSMVVKTAAGATVAGSTGYDATTRTATFTPAAALATATSYSVTLAATATTGESLTAGNSWTFKTVLPDTTVGNCPCSLYQDSSTPTVLSIADGTPLSLGVRFSPATNGTISGVKFYKGPGNVGTHTGSLYKTDGTQLATVTFTNESTTGWQTATFSTPVAVTAGTEYIAGYTNTTGTYSATPGAYGGDTDIGPLHVPAGDGMYSYTSNFPSNSSAASYLVDVIFQPSAAPLTISSQSPAPGSIDQPVQSTVSASFSSALKAGYSVTVTSGSTPITGTTAISSDGKTITFTPAQNLPGATTFNVTIGGLVSTQGAALADVTWSFTTIDGSQTPTSYSLFGSLVPQTPSNTGDTAPIELGVAFTTSTAGTVTAIRFYKGPGNTGVHTGSIWSSAGVRLATVQFSNETAGGWQSATLATPLALAAGSTYTVSYYAPNGAYASTSAFFVGDFVKGPLTVAGASNGRYLYASGGGMPVNSWNSSNYFVDLVFTVAAGS